MKARARLLLVLLPTLVACAAEGLPDGVAVDGLTVCHDTVVEGIDVAEFQGAIDWDAVHASGREFAIARIGDGTYIDPTFARNWAGIRAAGMVRGAYLFFRPTVSAATQAAAIHAAVGTLGDGDLPVTIDVECMCPFSTPGHRCEATGAGCRSPGEVEAVLVDLIARVQADTGKVPMIYTGAWFWDGSTYLSGASSHPENALWISGYTSGCVTVASGWTDWQFWQYSDGTCAGCVGGAVPGVSVGADVDRNRWNGTLAELRAFAGGSGGAAYGARFVMQSFPYTSVGAVQIRAGETASAWLEMRNTGTAAWDANTFVATTGPRDRTGTFAGPDWRSPNRVAGVPAGMTVAPGETFRFMWTWAVPASAAPGMYDEHFGMVEDGVGWFSDPGQGGPPDDQLEAILEVLPGVDGGDRPDASARDAGSSDGSARLDASASGDAGDVGAPRPVAGGCACRASESRASARGAWALLLVGLATASRRRRDGGACTPSRPIRRSSGECGHTSR